MRLLRESDSLQKNNLTVPAWNEFYTPLAVLYVHRKIAVFFDHSRLSLENKFFPNKRSLTIHPPTLPLFYNVTS